MTITLKNIPETVHARLKEQAARNHRSLNKEAIACLEMAIPPAPRDPEAIIAEARAFRRTLKFRLTPAMVNRAKRQGRP